MIQEKIENEKFVFNFCYDEKIRKFSEVNFSEKKMNELEKKILTEACLLFPKCNMQELYEHLIIRIENKLRDFSKITYSGTILPENVSKEYDYFQKFFRKVDIPLLHTFHFLYGSVKEKKRVLQKKLHREKYFDSCFMAFSQITV